MFIARPSSVGSNLRRKDPSAEELAKLNEYHSASSVYSQLGRLRAATADTPPVSLIISPYFPYPSEDAAFFEELSLKNRKLKLVILDYFSALTAKDLKKKGELKVKEELLQLLNKELVMGSVSALYFDEYIILD